MQKRMRWLRLIQWSRNPMPEFAQDNLTPRLMPDAQYYSEAPGRVNLLGEHVDYNGGAVLPMAINRLVRIEAKLEKGGTFHIEAIDLGKSVDFSLNSVESKKDVNGKQLPGWALYPAGVAWVLKKEGFPVKGIHAAFRSSVPVGAGLSSSAAVEVAFAAIWQVVGDWKADPLKLAILCQRAENQYVGVNCGLMDQFASACGVEGSAVWFDTRSYESRAVKLPENTVVVVADTGVRRGLVSSAYNERRASCEEALRHFQGAIPGIKTLREVSIDDFNRFSAGLAEIPLKRSRYIVHECARMDHALDVLSLNDATAFGRLMNETHSGLRDDYEVSCAELDALAETAWKLPGCYGSRLTGAGFGGCTVSLVERVDMNGFVAGLKAGYLGRTGRNAEVYICEAVSGAKAGKFPSCGS
jgi:galactokinase